MYASKPRKLLSPVGWVLLVVSIVSGVNWLSVFETAVPLVFISIGLISILFSDDPRNSVLTSVEVMLGVVDSWESSDLLWSTAGSGFFSSGIFSLCITNMSTFSSFWFCDSSTHMLTEIGEIPGFDPMAVGSDNFDESICDCCCWNEDSVDFCSLTDSDCLTSCAFVVDSNDFWSVDEISVLTSVCEAVVWFDDSWMELTGFCSVDITSLLTSDCEVVVEVWLDSWVEPACFCAVAEVSDAGCWGFGVLPSIVFSGISWGSFGFLSSERLSDLSSRTTTLTVSAKVTVFGAISWSADALSENFNLKSHPQ